MRKPKSIAGNKFVKPHLKHIKAKGGPKAVLVRGHFTKKPKKH